MYVKSTLTLMGVMGAKRVLQGWLCWVVSFSHLRSAIVYIRGACSSIGHVHRAPPSLDVLCVESHLNIIQ